MNGEEIRMVLLAHGLNAAGASHPIVADALAWVDHTSMLEERGAEQQTVDAEIKSQLRQIAVPSQLQEEILKGLRAKSRSLPQAGTNDPR